MKILLVTPSYYPIIGGSEALTRILSIKLNEVGICTDIMTFNMDKKWDPLWKEELVKDGSISIFREPAMNPVHSRRNPMFSLFRMNVIPKPTFTRKFRNYDVIHFIGEADLSFPLFSLFIKKPKLLQCVGIFRKGGIYKYYTSERASLGKVFEKLFPNLADKFVISTREKALLSDLGVPESKIAVLPVGVDTQCFRPEPTKKIDNMILFVGRIDRIKGLHLLLKALPYLKIPVQLIVIGPPWDPEYVKEIRELSRAINKEGIHEVRLLGAMEHNDIVSWYQKASILVCPYLYETFNTVTLEALASGTPVVSTGTHITSQGSDGILVTPKDPRKLAGGIRRLLEDKELRIKYGREGRKLVEQRFSLESIIKRLIEIYNDLLAD